MIKMTHFLAANAQTAELDRFRTLNLLKAEERLRFRRARVLAGHAIEFVGFAPEQHTELERIRPNVPGERPHSP